MKTELLCQPASTVARLTLAAGETVTCEVGAMIAMSDGLTVETTSRSRGGGGGLMSGMRRVFSGESFFLNHFEASQEGAHLIIGPTLMGDIMHHRLSGGTVVVQGSSWLASGPGVTIDTTFQGLGKALLSGESVFWVKCSGTGDLLLNSFGAIYPVDVDGEYVVDTGHIVAFEDTLGFTIAKASESLIGSLLGGEGFVCRFKGRGRLWCQSHNPPAFGAELGPKLRPR